MREHYTGEGRKPYEEYFQFHHLSFILCFHQVVFSRSDTLPQPPTQHRPTPSPYPFTQNKRKFIEDTILDLRMRKTFPVLVFTFHIITTHTQFVP